MLEIEISRSVRGAETHMTLAPAEWSWRGEVVVETRPDSQGGREREREREKREGKGESIEVPVGQKDSLNKYKSSPVQSRPCTKIARAELKPVCCLSSPLLLVPSYPIPFHITNQTASPAPLCSILAVSAFLCTVFCSYSPLHLLVHGYHWKQQGTTQQTQQTSQP